GRHTGSARDWSSDVCSSDLLGLLVRHGIRLLLAKGADVNAVSNEQCDAEVKHGPIALGNLTALLLATPYGGPDVVKILLDAGARSEERRVGKGCRSRGAWQC